MCSLVPTSSPKRINMCWRELLDSLVLSWERTTSVESITAVPLFAARTLVWGMNESRRGWGQVRNTCLLSVSFGRVDLLPNKPYEVVNKVPMTMAPGLADSKLFLVHTMHEWEALFELLMQRK